MQDLVSLDFWSSVFGQEDQDGLLVDKTESSDCDSSSSSSGPPPSDLSSMIEDYLSSSGSTGQINTDGAFEEIINDGFDGNLSLEDLFKNTFSENNDKEVNVKSIKQENLKVESETEDFSANAVKIEKEKAALPTKDLVQLDHSYSAISENNNVMDFSPLAKSSPKLGKWIMDDKDDSQNWGATNAFLKPGSPDPNLNEIFHDGEWRQEDRLSSSRHCGDLFRRTFEDSGGRSIRTQYKRSNYARKPRMVSVLKKPIRGVTSHKAKTSNLTSKLTIHEFFETFNPVVSSVPWISPYPLSIKTVVKTKKEVVPYPHVKFPSGGRRQGPVIKVVKKSNSSSGSRRKEETQSQESKNQKERERRYQFALAREQLRHLVPFDDQTVKRQDISTEKLLNVATLYCQDLQSQVAQLKFLKTEEVTRNKFLKWEFMNLKLAEDPNLFLTISNDASFVDFENCFNHYYLN